METIHDLILFLRRNKVLDYEISGEDKKDTMENVFLMHFFKLNLLTYDY